ncbi:hypothetical protein BGZ60DRAFT_501479 [Tricladium varicosporioides]|nr:hypothetical protein BGZ60DRAFT_501479 [Hymenoscyphus varicosporioides]
MPEKSEMLVILHRQFCCSRGKSSNVRSLRSHSLLDSLINFNPQPGTQHLATIGAAMAQAPNLTELCEPIGSGENIQFDAYGHSVRTVVTDSSGVLILTTVLSRTVTRISTRNTTILHDNTPKKQEAGRLPVGELPMPTLLEQAASEEKHGWGETTLHGLTAAWKFACTPIRFVMTIYGLTIFAWGAMLFFLLLVIAPAMNHPGKDSDDPPRKKWIEIDRFRLAPWRFRDLYWLIHIRFRKNRHAIERLLQQNISWFRPPIVTFTGEGAPPTRLWKLSFVVWMMVWDTFLQAVLATFMWP